MDADALTVAVHDRQALGGLRDCGPAIIEGCYRRLIEAAPDAMVVIDGDGSIVLLRRNT